MPKHKKKQKKAPHKALDTSLPIFQIKIALQDIEPAIWRRIQTPDCTLADLHVMIQDSMGWEEDQHHAFEIGNKQYTDLSRVAMSTSSALPDRCG